MNTITIDGVKVNCDFVYKNVYVGLQKKRESDDIKKDTNFDDIEKYLYIRYSDNDLIITLHKEILEFLNMQENELWEIAERNTFEETQIVTLAQVLSELTGGDVSEFESMVPLYVVSNISRYLGASAILDIKKIKEMAKEFNIRKFVMLPSSIHECLIMPYDENCDMDKLTNMVDEINLDHVDESEQLADKAYIIEVEY